MGHHVAEDVDGLLPVYAVLGADDAPDAEDKDGEAGDDDLGSQLRHPVEEGVADAQVAVHSDDDHDEGGEGNGGRDEEVIELAEEIHLGRERETARQAISSLMVFLFVCLFLLLV